jgi:hypothetical protein
MTSNFDLEKRSLSFLRELKRGPTDYFAGEAELGFYGLEVFCLDPQIEGPIIDLMCRPGTRLTIIPVHCYQTEPSDTSEFYLSIVEKIIEAARVVGRTGELRGIILPELSVIVDPTRGRYDTGRVTLRSREGGFPLADLVELATGLLQLFDDDNPEFWKSAVVSIARGSHWVYSMHDEPVARVETRLAAAEARQ